MSRRQTGRAKSPDQVFAERRGELPYQIYFEVSNIGRNVESSKKRARWKFCFGEEGAEHEVTLVHSLMSGKKKTMFDGELINEAQKVSKEWVFAWSFGSHLLRVGINFEEYGLVIDGIPFRNFARRDPYLAAQLEATKRDSMKSLQTDEKRRFDRLGYGGDGGDGGRTGRAGGGSGRSRASEQRKGSGYSTGSSQRGGFDRNSGGDRGRGAEAGGSGRRSSSVEVKSTRSSPRARSSSSRRMQAPPSASGPGGNQRRSSQRSSGTGGVSREAKQPPASGAAPAAVPSDILSADPSTLEVNPFDVRVSASTFDPLTDRGSAGTGTGTGGGYTNGGGGGGGWAEGGGGGGGGGGASADSAAVLQLGVQFEAMGMNSQYQQPQQHQHHQHHQQYQQQQQHQTPFDHGAYQQYDQSGFPQQQQQQQQQPVQWQPQSMSAPGPFGDAAPNFSAAPNAGGEMDFMGGFPQPGQQQQQQGAGARAAGGGPAEETCTDLAKVCADPWDAARAGMVNVDDITDTKHLPAVEVKPFTDDHRPLADLVREAPPKVKNAVMIDRPEPPPTHMAVAVLPIQAPGQQRQQHQPHQQMGYGQGGYPQQQENSNNPFAQLQLTQFGQPAQPQPVLFSANSSDPFHRL